MRMLVRAEVWRRLNDLEAFGGRSVPPCPAAIGLEKQDQSDKVLDKIAVLTGGPISQSLLERNEIKLAILKGSPQALLSSSFGDKVERQDWRGFSRASC